MTRAAWVLAACLLPGIVSASPILDARKSEFEKALGAIFALVTPKMSAEFRERLVKGYIDLKPNKAKAVELSSGEYFSAIPNEEQSVTGDRTLEGCQLQFGKPCALIAVNEEIVANGALVTKDMPRVHYSGNYDPQEIPIVRSETRDLPKVRDYSKILEPKAMAIHPWGRIFVSQGKANIKEAEQTALERCNNNQKERFNGRGGKCFLYASNNNVLISKRLISAQ